jgi:hypothetical protein
MNDAEEVHGAEPVELAGHTWYAFESDKGPWTTPDFPEWEILCAVRSDKKPVYMVYAQLVYLAAFPDTDGLEDAAEFVAKHPENKAFATNEHSHGNDHHDDTT